MTSLKIDVGEGVPVAGFVGLNASAQFDTERGFGWVESEGLTPRDRNIEDRLLGRFLLGLQPATLRISLEPGRYWLTVLMADLSYGDHVLQITSDGINATLPLLTAEAGEYAVLTTSVQVVGESLDLTFTSPTNNWIANSVSLQSVADDDVVETQVIHRKFDEPYTDILGEELAIDSNPAATTAGDGPFAHSVTNGQSAASETSWLPVHDHDKVQIAASGVHAKISGPETGNQEAAIRVDGEADVRNGPVNQAGHNSEVAARLVPGVDRGLWGGVRRFFGSLLQTGRT